VKKRRNKHRVAARPINTNPQGTAISLCHHFNCNISYPLGKYVGIYKWESIQAEIFPPPHPERPFFFRWRRQQQEATDKCVCYYKLLAISMAFFWAPLTTF